VFARLVEHSRADKNEEQIMARNTGTGKSCCEAVRIESPQFLVNSSQRACRYETRGDEPLEPGFYVALWPERGLPYGQGTRYIGPLATRAAAQLLAKSAVGLGVAQVANGQAAGAWSSAQVAPALVRILGRKESPRREVCCQT
jgi:hypothetical protein